jgi:hypothetical protein
MVDAESELPLQSPAWSVELRSSTERLLREAMARCQAHRVAA